MPVLELVLGLIALAIVLTIPGYFLTLGFFPKRGEIDSIERFTFSLVFSIVFIPLLLLIENQLLLLPINFLTSLTTTILLIVIGLIAWLYRSKKLSPEETVDLIFFRKFLEKK